MLKALFNCNLKAVTSTTLILLSSVAEFKLYDRATHVFGEASRVIEFQSVCASHHKAAVDDRKDGEDVVIAKLGRLMNESHFSCSNLYECSCEELDSLTQKCRFDCRILFV